MIDTGAAGQIPAAGIIHRTRTDPKAAIAQIKRPILFHDLAIAKWMRALVGMIVVLKGGGQPVTIEQRPPVLARLGRAP